MSKTAHVTNPSGYGGRSGCVIRVPGCRGPKVWGVGSVGWVVEDTTARVPELTFIVATLARSPSSRYPSAR